VHKRRARSVDVVEEEILFPSPHTVCRVPWVANVIRIIILKNRLISFVLARSTDEIASQNICCFGEKNCLKFFPMGGSCVGVFYPRNKKLLASASWWEGWDYDGGLKEILFFSFLLVPKSHCVATPHSVSPSFLYFSFFFFPLHFRSSLHFAQ
jgi:hypothetical protein